ncbi:MAG: outer membrane lipoprotein-sorting protein [Helicobacteraceae bacterium]|nr:outer membrane lipoprotein-sorting protein [Helicobacteraceae bacterium]
MTKIFLAIAFSVTSLFSMTQYELAQKVDAQMSGFEDAIGVMQMTLVNASGATRVRDMKIKTLELSGGDKSLMEFDSPADVKGTKFLNYEHADRDDDQWLYLPALKRVKRISSKNKSGSFMGSQFSYEDLGAFNIDKYTYKDEPAKEVTYEGKKYLENIATPKSKYSGYTSQVTLIDPSSFLAYKVDYYDRKHSLLKSATYSEYKKIGGIWRIGKIVMLNHQNNKKTILVWKNETIKNSLKAKDFHKRVLKK